MATAAAAASPAAPLVTAFAISDVQYADRADGHNYTRTKTRHYRAALGGLRRAVASWLGVKAAAAAGGGEPGVYVALQLGDLLDGFAAATERGAEATLEALLAELARLDCPVYHCIGNHELYCFDRAHLQRTLFPQQQPQQPPPPAAQRQGGRAYQACSPHPRFLFVGLDTYDVSVLGAAEGSEERALAEAYLSRNPNADKNSPLNLDGLDKRFVLFGGGVGPAQLAWLEATLAAAHRAQQTVVVFSHIPLHPNVCTPDCLLWNYAEVLSCLGRHRGLVALCLAGHCHQARVVRDAGSGTVHYTLDAPLEQPPPDGDAFSTLRLYADRIEVEGHGANGSVTVPLA